jgi:hypothetical protein
MPRLSAVGISGLQAGEDVNSRPFLFILPDQSALKNHPQIVGTVGRQRNPRDRTRLLPSSSSASRRGPQLTKQEQEHPHQCNRVIYDGQILACSSPVMKRSAFAITAKFSSPRSSHAVEDMILGYSFGDELVY